MSSLLVTLSNKELSKSSEPVTPLRSLQRYSSKDDAQVDIELGPVPPASLHDTPAQPTSAEEPPNAGTDVVQTIWKPFKNRFRVLACCIGAFTQGMNDSAPGAIIASIENHYHITYGTVAIIFVCNALGYIVAAFFISSLSSSIGRAKTLIIAQILLILAYLTIVLTPPFAAVCAAFFVTGVGLATNLAIGQVFCANLASNTAILGAFQGAYGIGGIVAPLTATQLVSQGVLWSRFYFIELGLACLNLGSFASTFWNYEQESSESEISKAEHTRPAPRDKESRVVNRSAKRWQSFKTLVSDRPTVLGALFIFAYQGAEVAISGWVISFLVQFRHGDPSKVGFVTSGFWAGITIGRFTLSFLAHRIGERRFVFIVTAGALVLELLIWFVPSIPGDSVAIAFSGLLLGPVYPCAVHTFQQLIPRKMQISSLSLIGSVGSSGGAVAPFMVGMIAQRAGTFVLHPICIGLFVLMSATWWALPKAERKQA